MLTATISDFRKDIKRYLDRVTKNFDTLIINRGKDSGVVVMSLDEYNSLTANQVYQLSDFQKKRIELSREQSKKGQTISNEEINKEVLQWLSSK